MKEVYLHGPVSEGIRSSWLLNVQNPAEAVRAINVNTDGALFDNLMRMNGASDRIAVACLTNCLLYTSPSPRD